MTAAPQQPGDPPPLVADGAWCWFSEPRAVFDERQMYVGFLRSGGDVAVAQVDLDTGAAAETTIAAGFQIDDHAHPAVFLGLDGRLKVLYARHNDTEALLMRTAEEPGSIAGFGPPTAVLAYADSDGGGDLGYANVYRLAAEDGRLYLFTRCYPHWTVLTSDDDGASWSPAKRFFQGTAMGETHHRPYPHFVASGDAIHIFISAGHPREMDEGACHLYHGVLRGGTFCRSDGTPVRSLEAVLAGAPLAGPDLTLIHDAAAEGGNAWTWSIELDQDGHPVVTYAVFEGPEDHRYRWARWDGQAWTKHEVCSGGGSLYGPGTIEAQYSGGIVLDPADTNAVWTSVNAGGQWELQRRTTDDGGASWTSVPITKGSTAKNYRPYAPRERPPGAPDVLWLSGEYATYTSFRSAIHATPAIPAGHGTPRGLQWRESRPSDGKRNTRGAGRPRRALWRRWLGGE